MTDKERPDEGEQKWQALPDEHPPGPIRSAANDPREAVERVDVGSSGMSAPNFEQLQAMTDEQLRDQYDGMAVNTAIGLNFVLDEIRRRDADRAAAASRQTAEAALRVARSGRVIAVVAIGVSIVIGGTGLWLGASQEPPVVEVRPTPVTVLPAPVTVVQPAPGP